MVHHKAPVLSHWCIWNEGITQDPEDTIYSPCDECGSQSNHRMPSSLPSGHWQTFAALRTHCPQFTTRGPPLCCRCGDPRLPPVWKRLLGRPSHTWLRAVEADLGQQNIGLASAWRKAAIRDDWRRIVDTATLQWSKLWKKKKSSLECIRFRENWWRGFRVIKR